MSVGRAIGISGCPFLWLLSRRNYDFAEIQNYAYIMKPHLVKVGKVVFAGVGHPLGRTLISVLAYLRFYRNTETRAKE